MNNPKELNPSKYPKDEAGFYLPSAPSEGSPSEPPSPAKGVAAVASGSDVRWERSEYPHPKFPQEMRRGTLLPDVIWLRFHTVFRGGMMEEVTGWQSTNPNAKLRNAGGGEASQTL